MDEEIVTALLKKDENAAARLCWKPALKISRESRENTPSRRNFTTEAPTPP